MNPKDPRHVGIARAIDDYILILHKIYGGIGIPQDDPCYEMAIDDLIDLVLFLDYAAGPVTEAECEVLNLYFGSFATARFTPEQATARIFDHVLDLPEYAETVPGSIQELAGTLKHFKKPELNFSPIIEEVDLLIRGIGEITAADAEEKQSGAGAMVKQLTGKIRKTVTSCFAGKGLP